MTTFLAAVSELSTTTGMDPAAASGGSLIGYLVTCLALYGVFTKAGDTGWYAFVPVLNILVLLRLVGRPWWWLLLGLIPVVNVVIAIIVLYNLSVSFGRGVPFTIGLVLLTTIFLYILWLGSSTYRGPAAAPGSDPRTV